MNRLNDTDARAVDVLLDQAVSGGVTCGLALSARDMAGVSQTLELLSQMPPIEPPAGLADRVMRAIDGSGTQSILLNVTDATTAMNA